MNEGSLLSFCFSSLPRTCLAPSVCKNVPAWGPSFSSVPPLALQGCWLCGLPAAQLRSCSSTGSIWCQILQGQLEEAAHQLEFLKEVQQSLGKSEVRAKGQG